jgi:hypothetical protein
VFEYSKYVLDRMVPEESNSMFPKDLANPSLPIPKKSELDDPNVENSKTNLG